MGYKTTGQHFPEKVLRVCLAGCISYLLPCNKLSQNFATPNNIYYLTVSVGQESEYSLVGSPALTGCDLGVGQSYRLI